MGKERIPQPGKFQDLENALNEERRIMREIDELLKSTPDRAEAEKTVLEKLAPQMDEAVKKSREALDAWLEEIRRQHSEETKNE